ncbi:hypothetical protein N7448_004964 [Penicillium atrosanguineum]|nr:hypothetical protein N7448_004964 [Penicillium atrosanguineum]
MAASFHGGPTSKERKYDRQLRLWAASGQQALEDSRVLLVNCDGLLGANSTGVSGVVGVEALKNLVLPGIGGFTIVDPATVTEADLGVNFFLEEESLGKSRAQETCRLLKELNPDVQGSFNSEVHPDFLPQHKLVIISGPTKRSSLDPLIQRAQKHGIPILYTHSVGFFAIFSLQLPAEYPIVETHPDPESGQDLRLLNPWPKLVAAAAALGNAPGNYKEKTEFREFVRSKARTCNAEGGEENFDEAVAAVLKTIAPFSLRSTVREIFELDQYQNLTSESVDFWLIAHAIHFFYTTHRVLPLPGSLPDMKAQSADYVSLQNLYKGKARRDVEEVITTISSNSDSVTLKAIRTQLGFPDSLVSVFIATQILDGVVDEIQDTSNDHRSINDDALWKSHTERILALLTRDDPTPLDADARENIHKAI